MSNDTKCENKETHSWEYIGEKSEIVLVIGARRKFQGVEVGEWNTNVFCLTAGVRAHGDVPVSTMKCLI